MSDAPMKLLLVGPYPPPHGGISVHMATAHQLLTRSGACCHVLDAGGHRERRGGLAGSLRSGLQLLVRVREHARRGWTLHLHTNGHNAKSWLVALGCAAAAREAPARVLTIHSGMAPDYLRSGDGLGRALARRALESYDRVLCVNPEIRSAARDQGAPADRLEVVPAYLPARRRKASSRPGSGNGSSAIPRSSPRACCTGRSTGWTSSSKPSSASRGATPTWVAWSWGAARGRWRPAGACGRRAWRSGCT